MKFPAHHATLAALSVALLCPIVEANGFVGTTTRASNSFGGGLANSDSIFPAISRDAQFVAFQSSADNLVATDVNGQQDVFVYDVQANSISLVSVSTGGVQGNASSSNPAISADGRFVAFHSAATNLVASDTNGSVDVFLHDRMTSTTTLVSLDSGGLQGDNDAYAAAISDSGGQIAFFSNATNLVAGDTNGFADAFVRDVLAGTTVRVSVSSGGVEGNGVVGSLFVLDRAPSISADGRFVSFQSFASNLVAGDTNGRIDAFVHDTMTSTTTRVSLDSSGVEGCCDSYDTSISADGRFVAFESFSDNLVAGDTNGSQDVFVHDRLTGSTTRVSVASGGSEANGESNNPSISGNGRFVGFQSLATNLVSGDTNGDTDVFRFDMLTLETERMSVRNSTGIQGNDDSDQPSLSQDGRIVSFYSDASNLVPGADNLGNGDIFLRDTGPARIDIFCTAKVNSLGCTPEIGFSGSAFVSASSASAFDIEASMVLNFRNGILFYGYAATNLPFLGGTLCAQPPLRRTAIQNSGGSTPPTSDCSGTYTFDFNAQVQGGSDPLLVVGQDIVAQYWSRDPLSSNGTGLTNALAATVCP